MPEIVPRIIPPGPSRHLLEQGYSPALAKIFAARGITDSAQMETSLAGLLPFDTLLGAHEMARQLADAIAAHKRLLVIADYDADGATACTVAVRGLRAFGAQIDFLVPNRFEYGYGLTPEIVELSAARSPQPDILLTVDNGIASIDGVAAARQRGMQVLVTDHHLPGDTLPDADCIVNPNQPGCTFPSKNLAGVGVMFYVLLALRAELRARGAFAAQPEPKLATLLDLVALGTIADVVKLDQNNRILVQQGLLRIRAGHACAGISALLQVAKKDPARVSSLDLGFAIGPRLNAAGRLDDMSLGIACLLADDAATGERCAAELDALNRERRNIEAEMQDSALAVLEAVNPHDNFSISLFDADWHQGVIGILASRLKDRFHRPAIAFARANNGELKGSGRSISGLHLRDALDLVSKRHPTLLKKFGGHAAAAGLSIAEDDLAAFTTAFEQVAGELLAPGDLEQRIETDGALEPTEMNLAVAHTLDAQVWGLGFPAPQFDNIFVVLQQRVVGEKHLRLQLRHVSSPAASRPQPNTSAQAILFNQTGPLPARIHAVYSLSVNEYNGTQSLQLIIRHWQDAKE